MSDNKKKILVVDDSKDITDTLKFRFEDDGYEVDIASSGEECLKIVEKKLFDLIVLDIVMPGMDGIATSCRLKRHQDMQEVPIIFLTALAGREDLGGPYGVVGSNTIISKPFDYSDLLALVREKIG